MENGTKAGIGRRRGSGGGLAATLALLAVAACSGGAPGEAPQGTEAAAEALARVVNVEVRPVAPQRFERTVRFTGMAMAMRDVTVSAEEAGVVRRVVRDKGRRVRAGEPILELDDEILAAEVRTARAQAEYAQDVWQRRKTLYEEDGIGSELSYREARYLAEQAQGNLVALEARLARTVVRAPIDGVLDDRLVEVGSRVGQGAPVARIVAADRVKIRTGIPERYALDVSAGATAMVTFDAIAGEVFEGSVVFVGLTVDRDNRTFPIELALPNPGLRIKPGMVADLSVVKDEFEDAIVIPQQAVVVVEAGQVVYVVEGDGDGAVATARPVATTIVQGNDVIVDSGLAAGDRLVVVGQHGLTAGDRVRIVQGAARTEEGQE